MLRACILVCLSCVLVSCSNDNDSESDTNTDANGGISDGTIVPANLLNQRIKTKSVDLDQDGSIDIETTYNYDSLNRVVSRIIEHTGEPSRNQTITYTYQDGVLISKSSTNGAEDRHTYTGGLLTASTRLWDGEHSYQYNARGQLTGSTGDDYSYDIDCDEDAYLAGILPSFSLAYSGNQVSSIVSLTGDFSLTLNYNNQRFEGYTEVQDCAYSNFENIDRVVMSVNYDNNNRPVSITTVGEFGFYNSNVVVTYGDSGYVSSIVETGNSDIVTTVLSHNDEGLLIQEDVNFETRNTFLIPSDYSVFYGYEEGSCVVSLSSNPANLVIVESLIMGTGRGIDPYVNCGYSLDELEF